MIIHLSLVVSHRNRLHKELTECTEYVTCPPIQRFSFNVISFGYLTTTGSHIDPDTVPGASLMVFDLLNC